MSSFNLPFRPAAPVQEDEEESITPETPPAPIVGSGLHPSPFIPEKTNNTGSKGSKGSKGKNVSIVSSPELRFEAAAGPSNHQFWLKDAKIAEDLFTIHRSARHLVEFTTSMIGSHDPSLGRRPIPVMSDGDVSFMTQLSNDIARSVGGISAVRHHGMRTRKRKSRRDPENELHFAKEYSTHRRHHRPSRGECKDDRLGSSKRPHISRDEDQLTCFKCGRTETPEWRNGPDGLLCNVCGLLYAKQRRKLKGEKA